MFSDKFQVACGAGVANFRSGVLLLKKFGGSLTTNFWNRRVLLLWIFTSGWRDSPTVPSISSQHSITRVNNVRSWALVFINDFSFCSPLLLIIYLGSHSVSWLELRWFSRVISSVERLLTALLCFRICFLNTCMTWKLRLKDLGH